MALALRSEALGMGQLCAPKPAQRRLSPGALQCRGLFVAG